MDAQPHDVTQEHTSMFVAIAFPTTLVLWIPSEIQSTHVLEHSLEPNCHALQSHRHNQIVMRVMLSTPKLDVEPCMLTHQARTIKPNSSVQIHWIRFNVWQMVLVWLIPNGVLEATAMQSNFKRTSSLVIALKLHKDLFIESLLGV
jgi:hypothetical protein